MIAAAALSALAIGATGFTLQPGQPLPVNLLALLPDGTGSPDVSGEPYLLIVRAALALTALLLPVFVAFMLATRKGRRRLAAYAGVTAAVFVLLNVLTRCAEDSDRLPDAPPPAPGAIQMEEALGGIETASNLEPPGWLVSAASVALALAAAAAVTYAAWWYLRSRRAPARDLVQLARSAQDAADAVQAGASLADAVIRCYHEMSQVLQNEQGIQRPSAMTPREFEHLLVRRGLPEEPVRQLTRLFEQARYGGAPSGDRAADQAVVCLSAIGDACRAMSGGR